MHLSAQLEKHAKTLMQTKFFPVGQEEISGIVAPESRDMMNSLRLSLFFLFAFCIRAAEPLDYAPAPNDTYWDQEWHLENIWTNGVRQGIDVNAREAWAYSRGAGITIAIVDNGVDTNHPDLSPNYDAAKSFNFDIHQTNGYALLNSWTHGTCVAGIAAAAGDNHRGVIGVAPEAKFASWVIFSTNSGTFVDSAARAEMFQSHLQDVQVQNHSWALVSSTVVPMSQGESNAIQRAVTEGRGGKGVIIIRAAGNDRENGKNANDDAYISDPRAIAVAAARYDGRAASYSSPGADILVAGPSGDLKNNYPNLFTTDRLGTLGFNFVLYKDSDLSDYTYPALSQVGFGGTSASAPIISGISALVLSANPNLTYRDVQQILILAAQQTDLADPDLQENGAGFLVSHNTGFGVVNAGTAVDLARHWIPRPPQVETAVTVQGDLFVPDAGLRVGVTSSVPVPPDLVSIPALPSLGLHPDEPTRILPLVYVGLAANPLATNLTGKAALIQRGGGDFSVKIGNAANAGAEFAIVYNNRDTNVLEVMGSTDYLPIPAVFISQMHGEALANFVTNNPAQAQLSLATVQYALNVSDALNCEQVRVKLNFTHELRGDMRVTLVSPSGTRSVLQRLGADTSGFDGTWTYMTTHHFYESSQGSWQLFFSDEAVGATGVVHSATLEIAGVPIIDLDRDGLPDDWEILHLLSLNSGPKDDPDNDGYSNIREWIMGTDPVVNENPFALGVSKWSQEMVRLNFPAKEATQYEVLASDSLEQGFSNITNVSGLFPRTSVILPSSNSRKFFELREK